MDPAVQAEIKKQQETLKHRLYYDRNAEKIRARQLEYYYKRKAANGVESEKRGRKPKSREIVITLNGDGSLRVK